MSSKNDSYSPANYLEKKCDRPSIFDRNFEKPENIDDQQCYFEELSLKSQLDSSRETAWFLQKELILKNEINSVI